MVIVANPFEHAELRVPETDWDFVRRFTSTFRPEDGSATDIDKSPFRRYVDLWWAGMCIGLVEGRRTEANEWHAFSPGVVLSSDPWRIHQLQLVAIGQTGDPEIVKDPGAIVAIANEFAATGIPILIDVMTGESEPIWAVSEYLEGRVGGATSSNGSGEVVAVSDRQ